MTKRVVKSRTGEVLIKGDVVYVNDTLLVKNKYDAILPPSLTDDSSKGFSAGSIYLEEVDSIRLTGSTTLKLEAVCSYEEIA